MAEENPKPNVNAPPDPMKADQIETQQGQTDAATQTVPRSTAPRQPLFRR
jgi:hypothetical protein